MSLKIRKYFIFALAIFLLLAFTFTGWIPDQAYDTNVYAKEPKEPKKPKGSPHEPCDDDDDDDDDGKKKKKKKKKKKCKDD